MKSTGIVRKMDELGRVVIPIEIRNQFNIAEKESYRNICRWLFNSIKKI